MRFVRLTILPLLLVCCREHKPAVVQKAEVLPVKKEVQDIPPAFDPNQFQTEAGIPIPGEPPIPPVPLPPPTTNSCFDPNLTIASAVDLIHSGVENTQWFIVENKEVGYLKSTFDLTDTILIKNELLQSGWILTDSVYTSIGNENRISLKMQKDSRVCNIRKSLYVAGDQTNNSIQEWFEIRKTH
ncbi:hypothetical protein [Chitinophaga qingshengii]|uniref:Uncharacterized protein n=1 Tax=Chitinophaga qingshengii TaxID=1569794 RepID=A0ABR7THK5_9BACT|nr:hypothetical protein [Chitinophaga qingshengii]MBC9929976.1 hypothetical protein [Chitinophaga qingshengii]